MECKIDALVRAFRMYLDAEFGEDGVEDIKAVLDGKS